MINNLTVLQMQFISLELEGNKEIELYNNLLEELSKFHTHDNKQNYIITLNKYVIKSDPSNIKVIEQATKHTAESYRKWSKKSLINKVESEIKKIKYNNYRNILAGLYYNNIRNKWINNSQLQIIKQAFNLANVTLNSLTSVKVYNNVAYGIIEDYEGCIGYINRDKSISYRIQDEIIDLKQLDRDKYNMDFELLGRLINNIKHMDLIKSHYIIFENKKILLTGCINNSLKEVMEYCNNIVYPELIDKNCSII